MLNILSIANYRFLWLKMAVLLVFFLLIAKIPVQATITESHKIFPFDIEAFSHFGISTAIEDDVAIVGAIKADNSVAGAAYIFRYNGTSWVEEQKLTASDGFVGNEFGNQVDIDKDLAIVGAFVDNHAGILSGAAYIFRYNGTSWVEEQKLIASDAAAGTLFGIDVAIEDSVAVVGAHDRSKQGAVYVFRYDGTSWIEEQKLIASDANASDSFGNDVAITDNVLIAGAAGNDDAGSSSGSAYIFRYDGTLWTEEQKLTNSDAAASDGFGNAVSIYNNVALIGASGKDGNTGSAYIFRYNGSSWLEEIKLTASDAFSGDAFGTEVGLGGNLAVVGSEKHAQIALISGSAYVFVYDGTSWNNLQKLISFGIETDDRFGWSVGASNDAVIVGAISDESHGLESGAAYIFNLDIVNEVIVVIDLKPDSDQNSINLKSKGTVPLAILGSTVLDVNTIDVDTLLFAKAPINRIGQGKPHCSYEDIDQDGLTDLICHFRSQDLNLEAGDKSAELTGMTLDGSTNISGTDIINLVPKK